MVPRRLEIYLRLLSGVKKSDRFSTQHLAHELHRTASEVLECLWRNH